MSRVRPPYLICRAGTFYLRVRVPADLVDRVGVVEVRRSLRVGRLSDARLLGPTYAARLLRAFEMIRASDMTKQQVAQAVQRCFTDLATEADRGAIPRSDDPAEAIEQFALSEESLRSPAGIANGAMVGLVSAASAVMAGRYGIDLGDTADGGSFDLAHGFARALAEQQRLFQFRLRERLLPYEPQDPLFASSAPSQIGPPRPDSAPAPPVLGPTVGELVARYLKAKRGRWTGKTYRTNTQKLRYLEEHLGSDRPAACVSPKDVISYRDALLRLRANHHVGAGKSFAARQTKAEEGRIAPKTVRLIFETTKAFFKWARAEFEIPTNPAAEIVVDLPKGSKTQKARRPFTASELKTLFESPTFVGHRSPGRRSEPGPVRTQDAKFWVPILGLYTGMRLGEIVQLHFEDVHLEAGSPYLDVTEESGGEVGSGSEKHVKSHAGVRRVPIHPDIIALGFPEFVRARQKAHKAKRRLFFEVGFGSDGQASSSFSKWFGRLLDSVGLTDPGLVFHSFRHGMEDAFRNAEVQQYVIDRIIGHADGAVSSSYGTGVSLEVAASAMAKVKLPLSLKDVL